MRLGGSKEFGGFLWPELLVERRHINTVNDNDDDDEGGGWGKETPRGGGAVLEKGNWRGKGQKRARGTSCFGEGRTGFVLGRTRGRLQPLLGLPRAALSLAGAGEVCPPYLTLCLPVSLAGAAIGLQLSAV